MNDFHTRKAARTANFQRLHGVKMEVCGCCNGSGIYDHNGTPPCGWCEGVGRVRAPLNQLVTDPVPPVYDWRAKLKEQQRLREAKKQRA